MTLLSIAAKPPSTAEAIRRYREANPSITEEQIATKLGVRPVRVRLALKSKGVLRKGGLRG